MKTWLSRFLRSTEKPYRILGIGGVHHDANAALIEDGKVIAIREEERFTRVKKQSGYPARAIASCLRERQLDLRDIDVIAVGSFSFSPGNFAGDLLHIMNNSKELEISKIRKKMIFVPHYFAHIASAAFLSPFTRSSVFFVEGGGDYLATVLAIVNETDIELCKVFRLRSSLGYLWLLICEYLGYRPNFDEGKVMALASYGEPKYLHLFQKISPVDNEGNFEIVVYDKNEIFRLFNEAGLSQRRKEFEDYPAKPYCDLAASLQKYTELVAIRLVRQLYQFDQRYGRRSEGLCITGGVGLNSVMNGMILSEGPYKKSFMLPMMGDNGTGVGAALFVYHCVLGRERLSPLVRFSPYSGELYNENKINEAILPNNVSYTMPKNLLDRITELISEGKIVGWFQGRSECGPRALGNRSILADSRAPDMKERLNVKVKHREMYRPFAPSVIVEKAQDFFEMDGEVPFMLRVVRVLEEKRKLIPAVTHFDGTARIQTVRREDNPVFYDLIVSFEKITGIPILLNTSFNVAGEPIVETPEDALKCFKATDIDVLVLGTKMIQKKM